MTNEAEPTNMILIKRFFFNEGKPVSEFSFQYKQLTDEDKEQLGEGIRNGTLTY